ncbi:hypothetical protein [Andreprevotia sp. IGB-42]|uniref:hypothetical protein n=1 Tax=Andreprevotia sp. IGB-42 TaxID=2497473 RepID=UPI00135CEF7A|nr:hypothetical protein [Andreprevotia sp. IGB-42]
MNMNTVFMLLAQFDGAAAEAKNRAACNKLPFPPARRPEGTDDGAYVESGAADR